MDIEDGGEEEQRLVGGMKVVGAVYHYVYQCVAGG